MGSARNAITAVGSVLVRRHHLPDAYGADVAKGRTRAAQRRLTYRTALDYERDIPAWIDGVLKKAVNPNPEKRYEALSHFITDLRQPNKEYLNQTRPLLLECDPVMFWKGCCLILLIIIIALLAQSNI